MSIKAVLLEILEAYKEQVNISKQMQADNKTHMDNMIEIHKAAREDNHKFAQEQRKENDDIYVRNIRIGNLTKERAELELKHEKARGEFEAEHMARERANWAKWDEKYKKDDK